jgi:hypothetical protein
MRFRGVRRSLAFAVLAWSATALPALADTTSVEGTNAPIVRVQLATQANLTIRTWDRESVQIEGDLSTVSLDRTSSYVPSNFPPTLIRMARAVGPDGPIVLPAESFVVSSLPTGDRDVVHVGLKGKRAPGSLTITIPSDTSVVIANVDRGSINLRDYRAGTFILHVHTGQVSLQNVGGDGFVQVLRGPIQASDSNFNRLRIRSAVGNQVFERCRARQIEASNVNGWIVYDAGTFEPGLARFDSSHGNVAVGVSSGAQLAARVGSSGHVYTLFDHTTQVDGRDGEANATFGGGGPLVNATSATGNVYLYDGGLAARRKVPAEWRPAVVALHGDAQPVFQIDRRSDSARPVPTYLPEPPRRRH